MIAERVKTEFCIPLDIPFGEKNGLLKCNLQAGMMRSIASIVYKGKF